MKMDKGGLMLVGAAALVLLMVVKKSTAAGAPASSGQGAIGANAGGFWGNVINNVGGGVSSGAKMPTGGQYVAPYAGLPALFSNGTYSDGTVYSDPGQVSYNAQTGTVTESPLSGMYNLFAPGTYGF